MSYILAKPLVSLEKGQHFPLSGAYLYLCSSFYAGSMPIVFGMNTVSVSPVTFVWKQFTFLN